MRRAGIVLISILAVAAPVAAAADKRIISLAPSVTETLFAVGAGGSVVGVSESCDFPPEAKKIDRVGSYLRPNVEAVVAHRPDVVIAVPSPGNRQSVESLQSLGIRVVVVAEGPALADVYAAIETIAVEAGRREAGAELVANLRAAIGRTSARLDGFARKRVLMVLERDPIVAAGEGTLLDELLHLAGAENVAAGLGSWPRLGAEYLVKAAPEVILDTAMAKRGSPDLSLYRTLELEAARKGKIHAVDLDGVLRPGPRLASGLETLARLVHPEAFEGSR